LLLNYVGECSNGRYTCTLWSAHCLDNGSFFNLPFHCHLSYKWNEYVGGEYTGEYDEPWSGWRHTTAQAGRRLRLRERFLWTGDSSGSASSTFLAVLQVSNGRDECVRAETHESIETVYGRVTKLWRKRVSWVVRPRWTGARLTLRWAVRVVGWSALEAGGGWEAGAHNGSSWSRSAGGVFGPLFISPLYPKPEPAMAYRREWDRGKDSWAAESAYHNDGKRRKYNDGVRSPSTSSLSSSLSLTTFNRAGLRGLRQQPLVHRRRPLRRRWLGVGARLCSRPGLPPQSWRTRRRLPQETPAGLRAESPCHFSRTRPRLYRSGRL
jgi:hypothetical protein